jgi:anti-sigma28 factor (negative regulator of flagellin synthesis)
VETSTVFGQPAAKLTEIKEKIGRGEYRVDEHAIADAIMRRWHERRSASLDFGRWPSRY